MQATARVIASYNSFDQAFAGNAMNYLKNCCQQSCWVYWKTALVNDSFKIVAAPVAPAAKFAGLDALAGAAYS